MPPSSSLSAVAVPPILHLPPEVLMGILADLENPLDLYHISLTSRAFQALASNQRLWEAHYWRFYRAQYKSKDPIQQALARRRTAQRQATMFEWLFAASSYPSSLCLEPLEVIDSSTLDKLTDLMVATADRLNCFTSRVVGVRLSQRGTMRDRMHNYFTRILDCGKIEVNELIQYLSRLFCHFLSNNTFTRDSVAFLPLLRDGDCRDNGIQATARQLPDFRLLFATRMNQDNQLIMDLSAVRDPSKDLIRKLLRLAERYGEDAKELLAALASDQQLTASNIDQMLSPSAPSKWPRAIDVHHRAGSGSSQLLLSNCFSLGYVAQRLLGYLQRCEAISSLRSLKNRWSVNARQRSSKMVQVSPRIFVCVKDDCAEGEAELPPPTLKERAARCCTGLEEAMEDLALFRGGERSEMREYLDTLALFLWANMKSLDRLSAAHRAAGSTSHSQSSDEEETDYPEGSTRQLVWRMLDTMQDLGFAHVKSYHSDTEDHFPHIALWCPAYRQTMPINYVSIFCSVARRLGITAAPTIICDMPIILVIEEGAEPRQWPGSGDPEKKEWGRFFIDPREKDCIIEAKDIKASLLREGLVSGGESAIEKMMEPATPLDILPRTASTIMDAAQRLEQGDSSTDSDNDSNNGGDVGEIGSPSVSPSLSPSSFTPTAENGNSLAALGEYLDGRRSSLPWPLYPPLLNSTAARVPSMKAEIPRAHSHTAREDAEYSAWWLKSTLRPDDFEGGREGMSMAMGRFIPGHAGGYYAIDSAFFLETLAGRSGKGLAAALVWSDPSLQDLEDADVIRLLEERIFGYEKQPSPGIGGQGAGSEALRSGPGGMSSELLSRAYPGNERVEHRVGTVFTHRVMGYRGVIVGWDRDCAAEGGWIIQIDQEGGKDQPFYHIVAEDGSRRYVAQCNVEPAHIPAGSTTKQAAAILRLYAPLFNNNVRLLGEAFRSVEIIMGDIDKGQQEGRGKKKKKGVKRWQTAAAAQAPAKGQNGYLRMTMTQWMKEAWPHD